VLRVRLVIDTNVIVSALLHPDRTPALALAAMRAAGAAVLVDARIEDEYRSVLARPKFRAIDAARRDALLAVLLDGCERVTVSAAYEGALIDRDDAAFVEVALAGAADAVVTGNTKHYPTTEAFAVLTPGELLARCAARPAGGY
jgi:putative PIN family toxin of toxin-antitoxin system